MINARRAAAELVTEKLVSAEAAIDAAIAAVAALTSALPAAGAETQVNMATTQEALMYAIESCSQLIKSRTNIIRTHTAMRTAQDEAGLGHMRFNEVAIGQCPPPSAEARPALRVVAAA